MLILIPSLPSELLEKSIRMAIDDAKNPRLKILLDYEYDLFRANAAAGGIASDNFNSFLTKVMNFKSKLSDAIENHMKAKQQLYNLEAGDKSTLEEYRECTNKIHRYADEIVHTKILIDILTVE